MSARAYITIWCDGSYPDTGEPCTKFIETGDRHASDARRVARGYGWRTALAGGRDLCPACVRDGVTL